MLPWRLNLITVMLRSNTESTLAPRPNWKIQRTMRSINISNSFQTLDSFVNIYFYSDWVKTAVCHSPFSWASLTSSRKRMEAGENTSPDIHCQAATTNLILILILLLLKQTPECTTDMKRIPSIWRQDLNRPSFIPNLMRHLPRKSCLNFLRSNFVSNVDD